MQTGHTLTSSIGIPAQRLYPLLPGVALCAAVSVIAILAEQAEISVFGHRWIESLVFAIIIGTAIRSACSLPASLTPGIQFSAKLLLEIAVVLLGASLSFAALGDAGGLLVGGIAAIVVLSLIGSYGIGRMFGLSPKLATLIACGNSICGNSAIAAAAPAINANPQDVAASIAFTAILGIGAVLLLPVLPALIGLDATQYGIFAGLTVYAVPQVLAATSPLGLVAVQTGTLVKLTRVLMLGPVIAVLSFVNGRSCGGKMRLSQMLPWFIAGFAVMMTLRSFDLLPEMALAPMRSASNVLTIMAMAALGLSVDIRSLRHAGGRVIAAASLSLMFLGFISLGLIALIASQ